MTISSRLAFISLLTAILLAIFLGPLAPARADSPTIPIPVALAPVQRDTPIELVALTLDARVGEFNGHTVISGTSTFKLHNTDKLNDLYTTVGFPAWAGDPYVFDPARLSSFAATLENKKVNLTPGRADLKIGGTVRTVDWYTFTLSLASDEKKTVRYDFQQDLGEGALPRFVYGLLPAASWKGSIGSGRLTLRFPDDTTPEQLVAYDPANVTFDGDRVTWNFATYEPPSNASLTLLRPSLWNELITRRRSVQQNPNDASTHASLGMLLRQLATGDSPRRDSFAAQTIAELETATRLDPNQRAARQALGAIYESRAGPASGPRQPGYVLLAVTQWEALGPGDATVRKQLAEDYFYLGLDAHTRRAFAEALQYYDKAAALTPNGAGPLFTPEHAAAQRRALNIDYARALLEKQDFPGANRQARAALGDPFVNSFSLPPFYVARADITMSPHLRTILLPLGPYAFTQAELAQSLSDLLAPLRAAGAVPTIAADDANVSLTINIPFDTEAQLNDRLDGVGRALPDRPEWALARALVSPQSLDWDAAGGLISDSLHYREQVDLGQACATFQNNRQTISTNLRTLENASTTDTEAQLKRALLKNAQDGWQRALTQGRVTFRMGSNETTVEPCAARTVEVTANPVRIQFIAALAAIAFSVTLALLVLIGFRLRRAPRRPAGNE